MSKTIYIFMYLFIFTLISTNFAFGHKLISHDDNHKSFEDALQIPDHEISWAIYENLGPNEARFYAFEAKHGDLLYASIVVPKIDKLVAFEPTLFLVGEGILEQDPIPYDTSFGVKKISYEGEIPSREFFEPFGQVTYWERQEIKMEIPNDGEYFIVVLDEKNQSGKYSLAIGTIEDFSSGDLLTVLPKAWFDTKLFVNDYVSIGIAVTIMTVIPIIPIFYFLKKRMKRNIIR